MESGILWEAMLGRANSSKKTRLDRDGSNPWKRAAEVGATLK